MMRESVSKFVAEVGYKYGEYVFISSTGSLKQVLR